MLVQVLKVIVMVVAAAAAAVVVAVATASVTIISNDHGSPETWPLFQDHLLEPSVPPSKTEFRTQASGFQLSRVPQSVQPAVLKPNLK